MRELHRNGRNNIYRQGIGIGISQSTYSNFLEVYFSDSKPRPIVKITVCMLDLYNNYKNYYRDMVEADNYGYEGYICSKMVPTYKTV